MTMFTSNRSIIVTGVLILITVLVGLHMFAAIALKERAHRDKPDIVPSLSVHKNHASKRLSPNTDTLMKDQVK